MSRPSKEARSLLLPCSCCCLLGPRSLLRREPLAPAPPRTATFPVRRLRRCPVRVAGHARAARWRTFSRPVPASPPDPEEPCAVRDSHHFPYPLRPTRSSSASCSPTCTTITASDLAATVAGRRWHSSPLDGVDAFSGGGLPPAHAFHRHHLRLAGSTSAPVRHPESPRLHPSCARAARASGVCAPCRRPASLRNSRSTLWHCCADLPVATGGQPTCSTSV